MGGPNDISRGKDGNYYIAEQEDGGNPAYVTRPRPAGQRARQTWRAATSTASASTRRGDIYAGLTQNRGVDKFVRVG